MKIFADGGLGTRGRMKFLFSAGVVCMVLISIYGCSTAPVQGIHMSRNEDVEAGNETLTVSQFGPDDIPAVVVTGCGGHNVTVLIKNISSGAVVKTYKEYVPEDWVRWWWFKDLPGGSYRAELVVQGKVKARTEFVITK